jgi:KipI family sensor histidine kinase inhibitor
MGDRGLLVELGCGISPEVNRRVQRLMASIEAAGIAGVRELTPAYRSLLVMFDPLALAPADLAQQIRALLAAAAETELPAPKVVTVPVVYGGERGPDLDWVADHQRMSSEEVVRLHTGTRYRVYMIGFTPGYPYMGELPERLAPPRRPTPRIRVPKGSVGIAQRQTGIYPVDSPGGWQIIGWTPVALFDPLRRPPSLLQMGDAVEFVAVGPEEAVRWRP